MNILLKAFCILIGVFAASCKPSINFSSTHLILVEAHENREDNIRLLEDLLSYDQSYVMRHIKSYDAEAMAGGLNLGYHIPSDEDVNPSYRYIFKMNNTAVRKNSDKLQSDFERYIPELIDTQISKQNLYKRLEAPAKDWILSILGDEFDAAYDEASDVLKNSITRDDFQAHVKNIKSQSGELVSTYFLRGHYYEDFNGVDVLANISFDQAYSKDKNMVTSVAMIKEDGKWIVAGAYFTPIN